MFFLLTKKTLFTFNNYLLFFYTNIINTWKIYLISVLLGFNSYGSFVGIFMAILIFFNKLLQKNDVSINLGNSLSNIHPITIIWFLFTIFNGHKSNKLKSNIVFIPSITLGGLWAFQEYNWGGWWNWDLIETSILLFLLIYLYINHRTLNFLYLYSLKNNTDKGSINSFLFMLFFNQFVVDNSQHSFTNFFFYIEFLGIIGLPLVFFFIILFLIKLKTLSFLKFLFFLKRVNHKIQNLYKNNVKHILFYVVFLMIFLENLKHYTFSFHLLLFFFKNTIKRVHLATVIIKWKGTGFLILCKSYLVGTLSKFSLIFSLTYVYLYNLIVF